MIECPPSERAQEQQDQKDFETLLRRRLIGQKPRGIELLAGPRAGAWHKGFRDLLFYFREEVFASDCEISRDDKTSKYKFGHPYCLKNEEAVIDNLRARKAPQSKTLVLHVKPLDFSR